MRMKREEYERIFRRMHPRTDPTSPYERQRELRNLWPADQQKFIQEVDAVIDCYRDAPHVAGRE